MNALITHDPAHLALQGALQRLEDAVDQETADLEANRPIDLLEANRRKSRILLELSRMLRTVPIGSDGPLQDRMQKLRGKLLNNQAVLGAHLFAVQAIAEILAGVAREAESDGTYSVATPGRAHLR